MGGFNRGWVGGGWLVGGRWVVGGWGVGGWWVGGGGGVGGWWGGGGGGGGGLRDVVLTGTGDEKRILYTLRRFTA